MARHPNLRSLVMMINQRSTLDAQQDSPAARRITSTGARVARRIGAVLAGLAINVVGAGAVDGVLHATGVFPAPGLAMAGSLFGLALLYRLGFGVMGSSVTARLAPDRSMRHALVLGAIGATIGTVGMIAMWGVGPAWYPLALIVSALPCGWAGARLHARAGVGSRRVC
jgi:hypothetical protein